MENQLPKEFEQRMQMLLGEEWEPFRLSYGKGRAFGLRRNPLKSDREKFEKAMPFTLCPIPWVEEGYYYIPEEQPGRHRYHEAGAYYIQEPSAMAAVEVLDPKPGEKVCDLCAAPGGKSTQIAGRMQGEGLLISNEIYPARARILSQNMERLGVVNGVVLNESTEHIAERCLNYFDRVLVDAPCSGEGMFRKEEDVCSEWSLSQVKLCAKRQASILEDAAKILRGGGIMVYSTCTFSPEENEGVITRFLEKHPEFTLMDCGCKGVEDRGRSEWVENPAPGLNRTLRLWPHKLQGEGHFIAKLRKEEEGAIRKRETVRPEKRRELLNEYRCFTEENLTMDFLTHENVVPLFFGEELYAVPANMLSMKGLRVIRAGLHLGTNKKKRFEPSHALAMALPPGGAIGSMELLDKAPAYFAGETISCEEERGWVLLTTGGFTAGWGKAQRGILKNHYPKGLRRTLVR